MCSAPGELLDVDAITQKEFDAKEEQALALVQSRKERRERGETVQDSEIQDETLRAHVWELEFEPAPRITLADDTGDRRTIERRLDTSLFLLVKKDRESHAWQFPQGGWEEDKDGHSLRATAERELKEECGEDLPVYFVSNAPNAMYAYEFPPNIQESRNAFGAKVFHYRAWYQGIYGDSKAATPVLNAQEGLVDFAWVAPDEMHEYLPAGYCELLEQVL